MLLPVPGRYMTLPDLDRELAMSLAASIRRSSIRPGPATFVASEMSRADSLSPSARMTAAFLSYAQCHGHQRKASDKSMRESSRKETVLASTLARTSPIRTRRHRREWGKKRPDHVKAQPRDLENHRGAGIAHLVSFQDHEACALSILLRHLLGFHSLGELHGRKFGESIPIEVVGSMRPLHTSTLYKTRVPSMAGALTS